MQMLQINDFNCDQCGLVAPPGTCELCRNRVPQTGFALKAILAEIAMVSLILVFVLVTIFSLMLLISKLA